MAATSALTANSGLASPEEIEKIAQLRGQLDPEPSKMKADGIAWPHVTSDIFMTRVLRGNDGSIEEGAKWYCKHLEWRTKLGLDEIYKKNQGKSFKMAVMPHWDEMSKYCTHLFDEDDFRTAQGDLLWYDSWGDAQLKLMMDNVTVPRAREFLLTAEEILRSRIDALSHEQGRLVKVARVMDLEGVAISQTDSRWSKFEKEELQPSMMNCSIEANLALFFINFPNWAWTIFNVASKAFPKKVIARFRVKGADFQSDPEVLSEVGTAFILRAQATRKKVYADNTSLNGTGKCIQAGSIMERVLEVTPGCQVLWNFKIGTAADAESTEAARGMLGKALDTAAGDATDLLFQVKYMPQMESVFSEVQQGDLVNWEDHVVDVVPPTTVDAGMGQLDGKTVVDRPGMICVSWSNATSWVRGRVMADYRLVVNRPDDDVGSFHSGDD